MNREDLHEPQRSRGVSGASASELFGGALFVLGALPAAAVAKALIKGTNLQAEGLGGFAWVASQIVHWVGAWPGILTAAAIALVGALLFAGSLRTEPLRYVAGAIVSGFGLAAIASALSLGAGGQLGDNTGGALGGFLGVLLGLGIIGVSFWLAFVDSGARDEDGFAPVRERGDGFGLGARIAGAASTGAAAVRSRMAPKEKPQAEDRTGVKAARESRRIQTQKRKVAEPATLGEALARGDGSEGVSHDEAAALAPDDQALAYMESVWRNAAMSFKQPEPIPPSPYPEDVRLSGQIPDGAAPLGVLEGGSPAPEGPVEFEGVAAQEARAQAEPAAPSIAPVEAADVAPFDFPDELGAPEPFTAPPAGVRPIPAAPAHTGAATGSVDDPFGDGAVKPLPPQEREALEAAARREAGEVAAPRPLPDGVTPLVPAEERARAEAQATAAIQSPSAEEAPGAGASGAGLPGADATVADVQGAAAAVQPAEFTPPPQPSWEVGYEDAEASEPVPEVDPATGHWARRGEDPEAALDDALASLAGEVDGLEELALDDATEEAAVEDAAEEVLAEDPASEESASLDPQVDEPEATEETDSEELGELDTEEVDADAELEDDLEAEEDEEVEYEYVDEDGNPIDPEELAEGDWEEVEEDGEEAAELNEEEDEEEDDEESEAAEYEDDEDVEYEEEDELEEEDEAAEVEAAEVEDSESEEEEEDEEVEYEYVDEDGNPIDPEELEDGEWEEVEEVVAEDEDEDVEDEVAAEASDEDPELEAEDDGVEYEEVDEDEGPEEAGSADNDPTSEDSAPEPEVVLSPQPPPAARDLSPDAHRLFEAGQLLVREGRVAVSILQNNFGVPFDEACGLLDELQAEGLIGPYQGGKARDILLSAAEWESRFVGS